MRLFCDEDESTWRWGLRNGFVALCIGVGERLADKLVLPVLIEKAQQWGWLKKEKEKIISANIQIGEVEIEDDE